MQPNSPTPRTWRYERASVEDGPYYVSIDGFQVCKMLEDWPTRDFYWQVVRPSDTDDTLDHTARYCTATAAKAAIERGEHAAE